MEIKCPKCGKSFDKSEFVNHATKIHAVSPEAAQKIVSGQWSDGTPIK